jgi:hypothetical protein
VGQGPDGLQVLFVLQRFNITLRDHPTIAHKDDFLDAIAPFDFMNLIDHCGFIFGIGCIDFDPNGATLSITDQPDDNLLAPLLPIAVVAMPLPTSPRRLRELGLDTGRRRW